MPTSPILRDIMMKPEDDFMWITSHAFSEMRLLVEGALNLFEDEAGVLCRLAREADKIEALDAFNDIGTALYAFKEKILESPRIHTLDICHSHQCAPDCSAQPHHQRAIQ